jgi:hypothetical protein
MVWLIYATTFYLSGKEYSISIKASFFCHFHKTNDIFIFFPAIKHIMITTK